jgi:hypothetical protein
MSGHLILDTLVEHLINTTSFGTATEVVLSGASAGGLGALQHVDWLASKLRYLSDVPAATYRSARRTSVVRVTAAPLAGLFFPRGWPVLFESFRFGSRQPIDGFMSRYVHMVEGGFLQERCVEAAGQNKTAAAFCFDVSVAMQYIESDIFIVQNLFDKLQIHDMGLCWQSCPADASPQSYGGKFIRYLGARVNETLLGTTPWHPNIGFFIPSAMSHDDNLLDMFSGHLPYTIAGASLKSAFNKWYTHGGSVRLFAETCNYEGPCAPGDSLHTRTFPTVYV